jgi:tetratricopeptide (TPR) repeat protein
VVTQFPNIPDVLYDAALSAYNTGRVDEALHYLNKAIQLDPLFKKAQEFRKEIMTGRS